MLEGNIHLDETYYPIMEKDTEKTPGGKGMRGLSRNKMCIGCAWDGSNLVCIMEGYGRTSKNHTFPDVLTEEKQYKKLSNLLQKMKKEGVVDVRGSAVHAECFLVE